MIEITKKKLMEIMTIHLEVREELNHYNNETDYYVDGMEDVANEIIEILNKPSSK